MEAAYYPCTNSRDHPRHHPKAMAVAMSSSEQQIDGLRTSPDFINLSHCLQRNME